MSAKPARARSEPQPGEWMAAEDFENIVRLTPLVAIGVIARARDGRVLLGRRTNEPAKNVFFVPGSRITKNERLAAAFRRITREELGVALNIEAARFRGAYEHMYATNRFEKEGFGTHYITLAYEIEALDAAALPKDQHGEYVWLSPAQLLESPEVHENTKAYFT